MTSLLDTQLQKQRAACKALELVHAGMCLGLGSGSTANCFIDLLGEAIRTTGLRVTGVPTSEATKLRAERAGIPLTTLDERATLDLTIDGADEIGPDLSLIKGGGGCHFREKVVAMASDRLVVIADASKWVGSLGTFPVPFEIVPFGAFSTLDRVRGSLRDIGLETHFIRRDKQDGQPILSDNGNYLFDCHCQSALDPFSFEDAVRGMVGLVAHGLFVGLAQSAIIAQSSGNVITLERPSTPC